jgi:peptidoglycan/xylan/chitin deacetylase (PgdA/CDA1 family)
MRAISLLFHDVYTTDPTESGFVSDAAHRYKVSVADFEAQLEHIARIRADAPVGSIGRALSSERAGTIGNDAGGVANEHNPHDGVQAQDPPYALTFDDGGVSYHTLIADRLEARGWRGHCFVSTDFIGQRGFLDASQIRDLDARGHVIGSHSASHPVRFSALPFAQMVREWRDSRVLLEDLLGHRVRVGSVPGGYFSAAVARAAREADLTELFTSEPVTTIELREGLTIVGRFAIRRGDAPDAAMRLLAREPWARSIAWANWNAKALVKPLLGPTYSRVADWIFAVRRHSPALAATDSRGPLS